MTKTSVISIDLAKHVFQICALSESKDKVLMNKKVKRAELLDCLRQFEPTLVVMEACYSSNAWGRRIAALGHQVFCIPAFAVKPFLVGNKNDHNDALAIAEAACRPQIRRIPIKSIEQQDMQCLQRMRELKVAHRTATINQVRGFLAEYGIVVAKTPAALKQALPLILEDAENELSVTARSVINRLKDTISDLDADIKEVEEQLQSLIREREDYQRLCTVPGVGPIVAATVLSGVNDAQSFKNGRQFASWLGLTPRQHASGDTHRLGGISKRGNREIRKMLIHGARAVCNWSQNKTDSLNAWINGLKARLPISKVIVALANKLARILWVILAKGQAYHASRACRS